MKVLVCNKDIEGVFERDKLHVFTCITDMEPSALLDQLSAKYDDAAAAIASLKYNEEIKSFIEYDVIEDERMNPTPRYAKLPDVETPVVQTPTVRLRFSLTECIDKIRYVDTMLVQYDNILIAMKLSDVVFKAAKSTMFYMSHLKNSEQGSAPVSCRVQLLRVVGNDDIVSSIPDSVKVSFNK